MGGSRTDGHGFISKTTNGGATWQATKLAGTSVFGVDAKSVTAPWAVSYWRGPAWTSTNGGALWSNTAPIPSAHMVWDVAHVVGSTALAVGSGSDTKYGQLATLWRTTNGGASWSTVHAGPKYPDRSDGSTPQTRAQFNAVDAGAGSAAYVVGTEYPVDSAGQGVTPTAGTPVLNDVVAVDGTVAWAVGVVSGSTLTRVLSPPTRVQLGRSPRPTRGIPSAQGIDATDSMHAIVVGEGGWVARTIDGGATWKTWRASEVSNRVTLQKVAILDATHAVAVGDEQLVVRLSLKADGTMTGTEARAVDGTSTRHP